MNLTIVQRKVNLLLERDEVRGNLAFEGSTPSKVQVIEQLAKELPADPALLLLQQIKGLFGKRQATFSALVYRSKDAKDKFTVLPSHLKKKGKGEKKSEQQPGRK